MHDPHHHLPCDVSRWLTHLVSSKIIHKLELLAKRLPYQKRQRPWHDIQVYFATDVSYSD
jgi:hypothetical protein